MGVKDLRDLREDMGYSQGGLAGLMCVSRRAVEAWERGEYSPDLGRMATLARCLNVSIEEIMGAIAEVERLDAKEI